MMDLTDLGWNDFFKKSFDRLEITDSYPARVARRDRNQYLLFSQFGELKAELAGRLQHAAESNNDYPTTGDWVAIRPIAGEGQAVIYSLLERQSCFSRKVAGQKTEEHIIAANVDVAFIVAGLDQEFRVRRIERYLTLAWEGGSNPVIILNKADLVDEIDRYVDEANTAAMGVPVLAISARDARGIDSVSSFISYGKTAVFLGSSGVGKSTIINRLLGEERLKTVDLSAASGKGRHTTTSRQLILLPHGGIVIDTPGLREIQLWNTEAGLSRTFEDIEELADNCRFSDCRHETEPGCAVQRALAEGTLDGSRFRSYLKLKKERLYLESLIDQRKARLAERQWDKKIRNYLKAKKELKKKGLI
jgi:ribosome biogenesis GTPase